MRYFAGVVCIACILSLATTAWTKNNLNFGNLQIMPGISYEAEWNDNIYLDPDETDDYIHTVTPGIALDYSKQRHYEFNMGYEAAIVRYQDYTDNNYEEHRANAGFKYFNPSGWYISLEDQFLDTEDPYSTDNNYELGTPRIERWTNTGKARLGYEFADKIDAHMQYRNYFKRYDKSDDQWRDRNDHTYEGRLMYRFWPKTSVFAMYRLQDINYPEQQDKSDNSKGIDSDTSQNNIYHQIFTGLYFTPAAKISGEFKIGMGKKDFENNKNWNGISYNEDWELNLEANLDYEYSEKTRFTLQLLRSNYESVEDEASSYIRTEANVGLNQKLPFKLSLQCNLGYILEDYETQLTDPDRDDDTYVADANLQYKLRDWLTAGMGYSYEALGSSDDYYSDQEYVNNRVMFNLEATY